MLITALMMQTIARIVKKYVFVTFAFYIFDYVICLALLFKNAEPYLYAAIILVSYRDSLFFTSFFLDSYWVSAEIRN
jgi:hypothetical protein